MEARRTNATTAGSRLVRSASEPPQAADARGSKMRMICGEMRLFLDGLAPAAEAATASSSGGGAKKSKNKSGNGENNGDGPPSRTATPPTPPPFQSISLRGKVGAAFTAIGGPARGHGGAESVLSSFHATFLSHGMVVVGCPPSAAMDTTPGGTPLGAVASSGGGGEEERRAIAAGIGGVKQQQQQQARSDAGGSGNAGGVSSASSASSAAAAAVLAAQHVSLSGTEVRLGYSLGQWAAQVGALLHGDDEGSCE